MLRTHVPLVVGLAFATAATAITPNNLRKLW